MADCRYCNNPLYRGNIRWERPPTGRAFRVHRRCPSNERRNDVISEAIQPVNGGQTPQDTQESPVVVEGVFHHELPPGYRYFMTQDQAERVKRALDRPISVFGIGFEVMPIREDEVERYPEIEAGMVEVIVNWKIEE